MGVSVIMLATVLFIGCPFLQTEHESKECVYPKPAKKMVTKTMLGNYFLLSMPYRKGDEVTFMLYTTVNQVSVSINTSIKAVPLQKTVLVSRLNTTYFTVDKDKQYERLLSRYWAFKLMADDMFGVTVFLADDTGRSAESFLVLPVVSWGRRYYIATLQQQPFFHIVSSVYTKVSIKLKFQFRGNIVIGGETYSDSQVLNITLNCEETYLFSLCGKNLTTGAFSGTLITSTEVIGVLTGNCNASNVVRICPLNNYIGKFDLLLEMLMPEEMFGKEFIIFSASQQNPSLSFTTYVTAQLPDTVIVYHSPRNRTRSQTLDAAEITQLPMSNYSFHLTSNFGVQVTIFQRSTCAGEKGNPAMSLVVPMELFYRKYIASVPNITGFHYLLLAAKRNDSFKYDSETLRPRWMKVEGLTNYTTGDDKIPIGVYTVYSVKDQPFGCYMYGMSNNTIYIHPVGYNTTHINYICNATLMTAGDGIDNECDENIDEEEKDGKDNDQDSKIDEDLMAAVNGGWGAWSEWFCPRLCENGTYLEHRRECNNPPPKSGGNECPGGPAESNLNITCKGTDKICPSECWRGSYGLGCEGDCRNCEDDCEKINGSCQQCKLGFSGPERGCTKTCPPLTYGYACRGSCLEKCNEECLDTINGDCPETNHLQNAFLVLLVLPPVYLIYICIRRCTKKDVPPELTNSALSENRSSDQSIHFFDPQHMLKRLQSRSTDVTTDITTETVETTTTWTEDKTETEAHQRYDNGNLFLV